VRGIHQVQQLAQHHILDAVERYLHQREVEPQPRRTRVAAASFRLYPAHTPRRRGAPDCYPIRIPSLVLKRLEKADAAGS
jgi:hypothetical protein